MSTSSVPVLYLNPNTGLSAFFWINNIEERASVQHHITATPTWVGIITMEIMNSRMLWMILNCEKIIAMNDESIFLPSLILDSHSVHLSHLISVIIFTEIYKKGIFPLPGNQKQWCLKFIFKFFLLALHQLMPSNF